MPTPAYSTNVGSKAAASSPAKRPSRLEATGRYSLAPATRGEVHKIYSKYAKEQTLNKNQLKLLMKAMTKQGNFKISSQAKLSEFVDKQFARFDVDGNDSLSLDEFFEFYTTWLDKTSAELIHEQTQNVCRVEQLFCKYDKDGSFTLSFEEVCNFILDRTPGGLQKPTEQEMTAIIEPIIKKFDKNKNSVLEFEEFNEAYNELVAVINLHFAAQRKEIMETTGFRGLIKKHDSKEMLLEATKDRFTGDVWVIPYKEVRRAVAEAMEAKKVPLFLDKPPGELDLATSELQGQGEKVVQMQDLCMDFAKRMLTGEEVAEKVREALLDAMVEGRKLVLRMGQSTPDWNLSFNHRGILPVDFLDYHPPGKLSAEFANELDYPKQPATPRMVTEGFSVVLTSCFTMDSWKGYFKAKLPFGAKRIQPIQVMESLEEVAAVLENGLEKDEMDDKLAELDRLADLL